MFDSVHSYRAYLVRIWQAEPGGALQLRLQLENLRTSERLGFTSFAAMLAYLEQSEQGEDSQERTPTHASTHQTQ